MQRYANPGRFLRLADALLPWASILAVVLILLGLYLGLVKAPPDRLQGDAARIMYVHVPAAWMAMSCYLTIAVASFVALVWLHPLAHLVAKAASPLGAGFTFLALATGSIWGKTSWGTWWQWDGRMTSVLVLFFLYLGHLALFSAFDDPRRGQKAAALVAVVGVVILPVIKFSVDWWASLHQPASLSLSGSSIHPEMLWPLLVMGLGFMAYFLAVLLVRVKDEVLSARLRALALVQAGV